MEGESVKAEENLDRQGRILEAALGLLSQHGISGVSMRAVAREAGVALGLVNYYYGDKTSLIAAALRRIEAQDLLIVEPDPTLEPEEQLRRALRRVAAPEFLTTDYLSLRLQLWSLAQAHRRLRGDQHRGPEALPSRPRRLDPRRPARTSPAVSATGGPPTSTSCRTASGSRPSWDWTAPRFAGASLVARRSHLND